MQNLFWYIGATILLLIALVLGVTLSVVYVFICTVTIPMTVGWYCYTKLEYDFFAAFGVAFLSMYPSYYLNKFIFWVTTDYPSIIKKIKIRYKAKYKAGDIVKDDKFLYEIKSVYDLRTDGICYFCFKLNGMRHQLAPHHYNCIVAEKDIVRSYGKLSKKMIKILFKDVK